MNEPSRPVPPPPRRASVLQRTWLPWLLTAAIVASGAWLGVDLRSDRVQFDRRAERLREEAEETRNRAEERLQVIEEAESERVKIDDVFSLCQTAVRLSARRLSLLIENLGAIRDQDLAQAISTGGRAERLRKRANRLLDRCRDRGGEFRGPG